MCSNCLNPAALVLPTRTTYLCQQHSHDILEASMLLHKEHDITKQPLTTIGDAFQAFFGPDSSCWEAYLLCDGCTTT
jgi:hypothetical protein